MTYQALYRKWRPKVFEDVVGQQHIVGTIKNQISSGKIAHAYLFCGSRGTGKTSTAKIFARAVNCLNPVNGNPCNECEACKGILNGSIFDVVEIDGASNNKVDDVRNIRDEVVYPPADVKYKVYIIDEVHMLTTEAFNALLKTLEEPPEYVIFILATTEFHKIPATIISRCQKFDFKRISFKDTARRIGEVAMNDGIEISPSAVNLLAKAADGSLRDGLSKLDQCMALGLDKIEYNDVAALIGASDPDYLADLCDLIIDEDLTGALKCLDEGIDKGIDPTRLFSDLADYFRDVMMYKTSKDESLLANSEREVVERYAAQAGRVPLSKILRVIETLYESSANAKYALSPKLALETALLKLATKVTDTDSKAILERLEAVEEKLKNIGAGIPPVSRDDKPEEKSDQGINGSLKDEESPEERETPEENETKGEQVNAADKDDPEEQDDPVNFDDFPEDASDENDEPYVFGGGEDENDEEEIPAEVQTGPDPEAKTLAAKINDNLADIIKNIKSPDIGFANIIKSSEVSEQDGEIVFSLKNNVYYSVAKKGNYETVLSEYLSGYFGRGVKVKFKLATDQSGADDPEKSDPLDEITMFSGLGNIEINIDTND